MNATSWHKSYLAHDQSVVENKPTRIGLQRRECKAEDLKVPGEAYANEEADVDQHLVTLRRPATTCGAIAINITNLALLSKHGQNTLVTSTNRPKTNFII